MREAVSVICCE